jgi:hypothetical protein
MGSAEPSRWLEEPDREPRLLSAWRIARSPRWTERVNRPLTAAELKAVRNSVSRGSPFGDENWVQAISRHLNLQSTLRPRGRPTKRVLPPFLAPLIDKSPISATLCGLPSGNQQLVELSRRWMLISNGRIGRIFLSWGGWLVIPH